MNTCICCGAEIPEGRQVCWNCERKDYPPDAILPDGTLLYLRTKANTSGLSPQLQLYEMLRRNEK